MKLSYYWKLIRGKTAALNPAKFDIKHIWAVFQSWVRSLFPVPEHIKQQIVWREYMVKTNSPKCWEEGHCIQCGCVIKEKIIWSQLKTMVDHIPPDLHHPQEFLRYGL